MKKINPKFKFCDYYLLYTLKEGGSFKVLGNWSPEKFKELEKRRWFEHWPNTLKSQRVYPAAAILVKEIDARDFIIDRMNDEET